MTEYLQRFQTVVQKHLKNSNFNLTLSAEWSSTQENHRVKIRTHMAEINSSYFSRLQWAQLYDLNQRPTSDQGFLSIAHCPLIGGYSFSSYQHGFDIEDIRRISDPILLRTSSPEERSKAPHMKMLWVAKESAFKGLGPYQPQVITDLSCHEWQETNDPDIWSFQIKSARPVTFQHNQGFVMGTPMLLFSCYFI